MIRVIHERKHAMVFIEDDELWEVYFVAEKFPQVATTLALAGLHTHSPGVQGLPSRDYLLGSLDYVQDQLDNCRLGKKATEEFDSLIHLYTFIKKESDWIPVFEELFGVPKKERISPRTRK